MNAINEEPERHEIEALLPWHAAGTLSRRDGPRHRRWYDLGQPHL
jgi:hypothetical protein